MRRSLHRQRAPSLSSEAFLGFTEGWALYAEYELMRYAAWPGQATSYMLGMLRILDLRAGARVRSGNAFDLAAFHETLLGNGSLPLGSLNGLFGRE